jgi:DNA topoisomerase-1
MATVGHIIDLPKSKLGVDTDDGFKIDYVTIRGKGDIIKKLKKAAKKSDNIYLAPDPDREGEAIAWHVAGQLKGTGKIYRVTFNEITRSAVRKAIENTREIDLNLVNAQQARRVLDRLVGYKVSPFLWNTVAAGLSAGRVQSVALRIICEREAEIDAFVEEEYWTIEALLADKKKEEFLAKLAKIDGKKPEIKSQKEADKLSTDLAKQTFTVDSIKKSQKKRNPLPPYITSTLQQDGARAFYFSPKKTMMIAQQLYEGVELGSEGSTGLITYMRTDSVRLAESALENARRFIGDNYGKDYLPSKPNRYKSKKSSQDAHEAIRPTSPKYSPDQIKKFLTKDQLKLYTLIWNRFVASQMTPAIFDTTSVTILAGKYQFNASAQSLKFDGFMKVYSELKDNGNGNGNGNNIIDKIPELAEGDILKLKEVKPSQHFTKPPPRYSQATLVKVLESEGVGRPSTYATIISTLGDRKYVETKNRRLFPTELGKIVNKVLIQSFPKIFTVKFTAEMESDLDRIEAGNQDWLDIIGAFYGSFEKTMKDLEKRLTEIKESLTETTSEVCDKCGSPMIIKWGRFGRFLACSSYPDCKSTRPLDEPETAEEIDDKCDKCGSPLVIKNGRYGKFLACSKYPDCKFTKPLSTGVKCPKDGCTGDVVEKRSRKGKVFYGCSSYPKCDFVSWYKPINKECPECKSPYMYDKYSQKNGPYYSCPACKHKIYTEKEEVAN